MTRKLQESYEHLFRYIDANILQLKPASFMTDFERAMRNALRTVWPEAIQSTCWFHYCQAIKRHASQIPEFLAIARSEAKTIRIYYDVMCLPLLPAASIKIAFEELKMEAAAKHGTLHTKFMRYIESQWIKKVFSSINQSINRSEWIFVFIQIILFLFLVLFPCMCVCRKDRKKFRFIVGIREQLHLLKPITAHWISESGQRVIFTGLPRWLFAKNLRNTQRYRCCSKVLVASWRQ